MMTNNDEESCQQDGDSCVFVQDVGNSIIVGCEKRKICKRKLVVGVS